jgi:hypothetical protein
MWISFLGAGQVLLSVLYVGVTLINIGEGKKSALLRRIIILPKLYAGFQPLWCFMSIHGELYQEGFNMKFTKYSPVKEGSMRCRA